MSSVELIVTVQNERDVRARKSDGSEAKCQIEFDDLRRRTVKIFEDWLRMSKISKRDELEVLGMHLYRMIFNGEVGAFFEQTLKNVPEGERLRVQLSFQEEASDLARLPWEYLYYPDTETRAGFFLATRVELVLSRYMPLSTGRQALAPEEGPLRILIVVSQPQDLEPVISEPVIDAIQQLANITIHILDKPTVDNFLGKLEETRPHVLHFIGHGRFNKEEKKGEIALLGPDEQDVAWIRDREFTEYFVQMHSKPRLVFLHLCEGATIDFTANFAGLAPQLIREKIQAVVAMQYPITNKAAIAFSRAFYRELAKGEPIDHAVQRARWMITIDDPKAYDSRVFGTPVLYMHSRDGIIQPVEKIESEDIPQNRRLSPAMGGQSEGAKDRKPESGQAKASADSIDRKTDAEKFGTTSAKQPHLPSIFFEAERIMKSMNLQDSERVAIKKELEIIREKLMMADPDKWCLILTDYWDKAPEGNLKSILFDLVEKNK